MATMKLPRDFSEFLQFLDAEGARYLLIGGFAVAYYGYPRPTGDMDLWVSPAAENAQRVVNALIRFGFPAERVPLEYLTTPGLILRMGIPPLRLEIMTVIAGVDFEDCYRRRTLIRVGDLEVSVISLEDLRANKQACGRHKDLDDLENLPESAV